MSTAGMAFGLILVAASFGLLILAADALTAAVCRARTARSATRAAVLAAAGMLLAGAGGMIAGGW